MLRARAAPTLGCRRPLDNEAVEPIAADVRPGKDSKADAKYRLIAGMLGIDLDALKRREYQRRARRAFALAGVALAVMAITTTLAIMALVARQAAVTASHVAERRQKEAEDLVAFMLGDLNDKLAQVSRLDIMETVDDQAMKYFQAQPVGETTNRALGQRVTTLVKIGSLRLDQGRLAAAMASYKAALPLAARLVDDGAPGTRSGNSPMPRSSRSSAWCTGGKAGSMPRRPVSARRKRSCGARRRRTGRSRVTFQLDVIDNNVGHVMEARGRLDDATGAVPRHARADAGRMTSAEPGERRGPNRWAPRTTTSASSR